MRKSMKKLAAMLLAGVLAASAALPAMASDGGPKTYTVNIVQNADDKGNHTYGAYQIFAGDLASNGTLSNIEWGSGITDAGKAALGNAKAYAEMLSGANAADLAKAAATLAGYLASPEQTGSESISGLKGGYYLIQDENDPTGDPASRTKFILQVLQDKDVTVKSSVPKVEKKVQDINDSAEATLTDPQDSADYDIGDTVPYTITGTIGSGINNYNAYSFNFVDSMSKGLTLDEGSWDIKADGVSIKDSFSLTSAAGNDGGIVWTWAARDIKEFIKDNSKVILTYNCTLNENAVVGKQGNPNKVHLEFDNNPNEAGEGKPSGKTPDDTNIVFTYKTVFNKVQPDPAAGEKATKPLAGANFTLEKKVGDGDEDWADVTAIHASGPNPTKSVDDTGTKFTFSGLDDGVYRLIETQTPEGFNTIDPIVFTITAGHDVLSDNPQLTSLLETDGGEFTMTPNVDEGSLTSDVLNESGSTLPSTGGMGTTIFYVIGGILVLAAAIILISKRRVQQ